ncbi:hypothetical protein B566_EDAN012760 [Ephemera danica]|nr:hypothetical protein B566_EDAN012760 [Ephemera danica]
MCCRNNVIILHFYFMDRQVVSYEKSERTGYVDFLASTGGLLGLFHGFSVLSLVEVIYFLTLRLLCSWRRKHCNTTPPAATKRFTSMNKSKRSRVCPRNPRSSRRFMP